MKVFVQLMGVHLVEVETLAVMVILPLSTVVIIIENDDGDDGGDGH